MTTRYLLHRIERQIKKGKNNKKDMFKVLNKIINELTDHELQIIFNILKNEDDILKYTCTNVILKHILVLLQWDKYRIENGDTSIQLYKVYKFPDMSKLNKLVNTLLEESMFNIVKYWIKGNITTSERFEHSVEIIKDIVERHVEAKRLLDIDLCYMVV